MRLKPLLFVAALLASPAALGAPATDWERDFDDDKKSWNEIEAQIPPYPKTKDLIRVEPGAETSHRFYVDAASLTVSTDGVVRYTSVIKTAGGATNVTFEGMRCDTREGKLYAMGHPDGTWTRARKPEWKRIVLRDLAPHHYVLYREYFCPEPTKATPPRIALDALRRGVGLTTSTNVD